MSATGSATGFLLVKLLDIGFVTCIYFATGVWLALIIDQSLGRFDEKFEEKKHIARLLGEVLLHVYFIGIMVYLVRNFAQIIPSPFDGMFGFEHARLKELSNATVFTTIFVLFQRYLRQKVYHIHSRLAYSDDVPKDDAIIME